MSLGDSAREGSDDGDGAAREAAGGEVPPELVHVGKIVRARGVEGELEVQPWGGAVLDLPVNSRLFLKAQGDDQPGPYLVDALRRLGARLGLRLAGVQTPEDARRLVGRSVLMDAGSLPALPDGRYYHFQIVGLSVVDGEGKVLGEVAEILETGGNDVYVVRDGEREILLPATDQVVVEIDLAAGRMTVDLPAGLIG